VFCPMMPSFMILKEFSRSNHQSSSSYPVLVFIYGAAVVPDSGVGNTWQRLTLVLHEFLSNGLTPSRLHIVISFLGLPRFLVPGTPNRVMELMQEVARCTCPYHLRRKPGDNTSSGEKLFPVRFWLRWKFVLCECSVVFLFECYWH